MRFSKYIEIKSLILLPLIFLFIIQCTVEDNPKYVNLSAVFNQEFSIGDSDQEVILATPSIVKTNSQGIIYIADGQTRSIKVYGTNGDFRYEIGRSGQGPGEFLGTPFFDIDSNDLIHTLDSRNARATVFSREGEVMKTLIPDKDEMIWPRSFSVLPGGDYLIFRKLPEYVEIDEEEPSIESNIFHTFNSDFSSRLKSFGLLDSLVNTENEFVSLYNINVGLGNFWVSSEQDILYVPEIYTGKIFRFDRSNLDSWSLEKTIESNIKPEEAVRFMSGENAPEQAIVFTVLTGGGPYAGVLNSQSLGIFELNNGRLIHFSSQRFDNELQTVVELFESNGKLIGIGKVEGLSFTSDQKYSPIKYIWKDHLDRFYFIIEDGNVLVKVGEIKFD